ncbi:glutamine synthetase family protein [Primorskyibacter sp. S87]|uniref:glutamine synthetase family protein n=1 Tax=Primorskyibacter sp. S87 TaxID=3415126 RepID=UPI003C7B7634
MQSRDRETVLAKSSALETIRLCFVDQHGILRGKTIVAEMLDSVFDKGIGVPSTLLLKDTSHRTVFPIWQEGTEICDLPLSGASDVVLRPDPGLFFPLPWAPHSAIMLCDVLDRNCAPVAFSASAVLDRAVEALAEAGYEAIFGLEVEFQVFRRTDPALEHSQATIPPSPPQTENLTQGHQFLTETRYGEAEALLDHLRRMAEGMGFEPRTVEIEMGPSQFEFTFAPGDPKTQAARFVLFRTMVKEVCQSRGLHASFMAKPRLPNAAANGWHMHQSLLHLGSGENAFTPAATDALTPEASGWIAGLLDHATELCLLTNPTVNSYKRFSPFQLAPNRILWGNDNRGAMLRGLMMPGDPAARIENRVADSSANPYFAFAGQIHSGRAGLAAGQSAPPPSETPYTAADAQKLPTNLGDAITLFETSPFVEACLGADVQSYLTKLKRAEWERYLMNLSEWEHQEYFGLF